MNNLYIDRVKVNSFMRHNFKRKFHFDIIEENDPFVSPSKRRRNLF